ncbi:MAG: hypothetical protein H6705_20800 [Myxococcales bacterium]|nr:hypothetical protein [Myxococcales bacterium]
MKATLRFVLCRTLAVALLPVVGGSGCHDDGPAALPDDAGAAVDGATRDGSAWDGSAWDGSARDGWARDGSARDGSSDGAPDAGAPDPPPLSPDAAWRLAPPRDAADRWWLVTPDGRRRFALGVNTVMRDADCDGLLDGWIRRMAPSRAAHREWARLSGGESGGEVAERPYCFDSVGAFSETNDGDDSSGDAYLIRPSAAGGAGAPYGVVLHGLGPGDDDRALRDHTGAVLRGGYSGARIGDPFNPAYRADVQAEVERRVRPRRADPRLQMWFAGNEIGLFDRADREVPGVRDLRRWIWSACPAGSTVAAPRCAPHALAAFLAERYETLAALAAAWESEYPGDDFAFVVEAGPRPVPYVQSCNLACREDLQRFVHERLLPAWVALITGEIRRADPTHLVATPRLALASPAAWRFWSAHDDVWADAPAIELPSDRETVRYRPWHLLGRRGDVGFDLIAVNVYTGADRFPEPWLTDGITAMHRESGLPVLVSELGVRARIEGWSNRGGAFAFVPAGDDVDDQRQRGAAYQGQVAQLVALPMVVGASWHAWSDRYRADDLERQINLGLVQCDDPARGHVAGQRWPLLDEAIHETNCGLSDRLLANPRPPPPESGPAYPFGGHRGAMVGDALHVGRPADALDAVTAAFYAQWKARYLVPGCAAGERRVRTAPATRAFTVSEGQGYGLLIAAMMAGHDPEAQAIFDDLYRYARAHPSRIEPRLMAWAQDENCRDVDGANAATDGDLDIAYALLRADRQWGSDGAIDYAAEARATLAALLAAAVHPEDTVLLGDWVAPGQRWYTGTRTSDFMPGHFEAFARFTGEPRWRAVADRAHDIVERLQADHAPATGLLPDFVVDATGDRPAPAPADWLEGPSDGRYGWNACRTPWRLGVNALFDGDPRARRAVAAMNRWVRAATGDRPARIVAGYRLDGTPTAQGASPAFTAPFALAAMVPDGSSQAWLDALWGAVVASDPDEYFGDSIKLLVLFTLSNNGWVP